MVKHSREWAWSSLAARRDAEAAAWLCECPVDRPEDWESEVDRRMSEPETEKIRTSIKRGRPFGSDAWAESAVKRLGLQHTVRDPWRPKKRPK